MKEVLYKRTVSGFCAGERGKTALPYTEYGIYRVRYIEYGIQSTVYTEYGI